MKITVDASKQIRKVENFWNNIHFHPTDAIEDMWGQFVLDNIAKDNVAKYIRMYSMFEDIVTKDSEGNLCYDYTLTDERIDYLMSKGFKLLICFNFMPPCIASDPYFNSGLNRYKTKCVNSSAPADYNDWAEICYQYTKHLVERYGVEEVSSWYFHCWNEPDGGYWLNRMGNGEYDRLGLTDKVDEYIKLYDYFQYGVHRACDKVKVGGPSAAGSDRFIETFVQHFADGINSVTGEKGTRIDFFSIHVYSQGLYSGLPNKTFMSPDNIIQRLHTLTDMYRRYGFGDKEVLVDEWGASGGGFISADKDPIMIFRECEYFSAFLFKLIDRVMNDEKLDKISRMMICLSGQHESIKDFDGFRSFFTLSNYKKPIYNAYALAAKLGENVVEVEMDESDEHIGVIPTVDENGNVKIAVYYMIDEVLKPLDTKRIHVKIKGVEGKYILKHYRIDEHISNSYGAWKCLGKPANVVRTEKEEIMTKGELSLLYPEEKVELDGCYDEAIVMTKNSVSMIELIKE